MSDWLIDAGNTRIKLARREAPQHPAWAAWSGSEAGHDLGTLLEPLRPADRVFLATVADARRSGELHAALAARGAVRVDVRVSSQAAGLRTEYDVARLGVDRFLQLIAARALSSQAQLVVGVGSAMTVDAMDAGGVHRGGWIVPRPARIEGTLREDFAALRFDDGVDRGFGLSTADAVAGGLAALQRGLLREALALAEASSGQRPSLRFCGGGAQDLAAAFDAPHHPWLALQGLARWADGHDAGGV